MKIIINVMLLLRTEKKRENILSRSARFTEGNQRKEGWKGGEKRGRGERHDSRIECIKIINYKIHEKRSGREQRQPEQRHAKIWMHIE